MIIKNSKTPKKALPKWFFAGSILCILSLFGIFHFWSYLNRPSIKYLEEGVYLLCDAENIKNKKFVTGDFVAAGAKGQTNRYAFEGKYACKTEAKKMHMLFLCIILQNEGINCEFQFGERKKIGGVSDFW